MLVTFFIVAVVNLISKRKEKRSIGWVMLALCEHNFFHIANIQGWTQGQSWILLLNQLTGIVFPVLLLRHAMAVSGSLKIPLYYKILVSVGFALAIGVHFEMLVNQDVENYINRIVEAKSPPLGYVMTIAYTQTLIGITALHVYKEIKLYRKRVLEFTSNIDKTLLGYLRFFFFFLVAGVLSAFLFNSLFPSQLSHYLLIPLAFYAFFLASVAILYQIPVRVLSAHDNFLQTTLAEVATGSGPQASNSFNKIETLVKDHFGNEKLYLNSNLTIGKAAERMKLPIKDLSHYINEERKMNFYEFVNSYRVDEAKRLLEDERLKNLTLEAIGKKAGFNSRASFYRAFIKFVNLSPGEYLSQKKN